MFTFLFFDFTFLTIKVFFDFKKVFIALFTSFKDLMGDVVCKRII